MRIAITAASVRCAAGDALVPPTRCWAAPDPDALALGIPGVARATCPDDPRFPDDRKGSLAAAVLSALPPPPPGARVGLYLGTGLSSLTPAELALDLYPHVVAGGFDRVSCGPGTDTVYADATDELAPDCEIVKR